jgi:hypothetical protein
MNEEIEILNDNHEAKGSAKKMTAKFSLDKSGNVIIGEVTLDKGMTNRLSKERQKEVRRYLRAHAGKEFEVKHNSVIELIFRDDGTKVRITFKLQKS